MKYFSIKKKLIIKTLNRESISSIPSQNKFTSNSSKRDNLFDKSMSNINILENSQFQSPKSSDETEYKNNILQNIDEDKVQEMKRITNNYKNIFQKSRITEKLVILSESERIVLL